MTADTIEPRALALQGIGFDALATALQGFVWRKPPEPDPIMDDVWWQMGGSPARCKRQREEDELLLLLLQ